MDHELAQVAEELTQREYWLVDVLPEQVPEHCGGQYFAVEHWFLSHPYIDGVFRKFAAVVLKLNCYYEIRISCDGEYWASNPAPAQVAKCIASCAGSPDRLSLLIGDGEGLLTVCGDDAYMTLYHPDAAVLALIRKLAGSEGLFVWGPRGNAAE